jgi:hypothetical protein
MSSNGLQDILSYAEGLGMTDGDYLCVANALKAAFEKKGRPSKWTTYSAERDDIVLTMSGGVSEFSCTTRVKSISACNIKEPGPIHFKTELVSQIDYAANPGRNKTIEYTVYHDSGREGKLFSLFELIQPHYVRIKLDAIDNEYECYSYLEKCKKRFDKEYQINFGGDDSDDDCEVHVDIDRFIHDMRNRFIEICRLWFWEKYNTNEYENT